MEEEKRQEPTSDDEGKAELHLVREIELVYRGAPIKARSILSSVDASALAKKIIPDGPRELLIVIMVDTKKRPIGHYRFSGAIASTLVEPADIFRAALHAGAHAIILAHNHPSGDTEPSPEDIKLTERVKFVGNNIGIPLLDHIIISGEARTFSFLDSEMLNG